MEPTPSTTPAVAPHEDYGFFGPDSVTWKVFTAPTSLTVGFQRTVVVEMFEPFLLASVVDTQAVMTRPASRYDRTLQYTATVAFHDSASAVKAADVLVRIHAHIRGTEPISGATYDANDPDAQLWIHLTQWHSVLLAYEIFGPGPLSEEEELQYWAECRRAAELQTIDPAAVPSSRGQMREYYERMRPRLAVTEGTVRTVEHLLDASASLFDGLPVWQQPLRPLVRLAFRKATIATLPPWLRRLGGIRQSRVEDAVVIAVMRVAYRTLFRSPASQVALVGMLSPGTLPVVAPVLLGIPPVQPVTVTPAEAWARAGLPTPRERYVRQAAAADRGTGPAGRAPRDGGVEALVPFV